MKTEFRLRAALLALKHDGGVHPNLQNLNPGAILGLVSEVRESGLVDVSYGDHVYTVFYADICERGEMVAGRATVGSSV